MDAEEILEAIQKGEDPEKLRRQPAREGGMTLRERWRRVMHYQTVDRLPNMEFGYWAETLPVWHGQGLPPEVNDEASAYEYFGIENWRCAPVDVMGLRPVFEHKILEENDRYTVYRDTTGSTQRINKTGYKSIPQHIDFLLKDRKAWEEEYKPRLQPAPERVPANWPELAAAYNQRDYPLAVSIGSMVGTPRNWMGFERISLMTLEDPELLEEIVETLCNLVCETLARVVKDVEFDFGAGWEDICYNQGCIVGVDFMRDVVKPRYRRITNLLKKHGCHISWTDCDGNIMPVLDSFIDGGINCMFPIEVHGGSDPIEIRRRRPDALLQGGVCKMKLAQGREAIRAELTRLLPLVREGGFIPGVDHRVPANVALADYKFYLKLKRDMFGVGGAAQYDERQV
ncbi:MAG: hypothetical protein NTX50_05135 [Candidatus Sumerlaeota bacterium]|nr:hypothetical protein [Candidatus Sumerlaeota bacterium]